MIIQQLEDSLELLFGTEFFESDSTKVVLFGSRKNDFDIIIFQGEQPNITYVSAGSLDLTLCSWNVFSLLLSNLDPRITEPILTGKSLFRCETWRRSQCEIIHAIKSSDDVMNHLIFTSNQALEDCQTWVNSHNTNKNIFGCRNLAFSISLKSFANWYSKHNQPITFQKLLLENKLLFQNFWSEYLPIKRNDCFLSENVDDWIFRWKTFLSVNTID